MLARGGDFTRSEELRCPADSRLIKGMDVYETAPAVARRAAVTWSVRFRQYGVPTDCFRCVARVWSSPVNTPLARGLCRTALRRTDRFWWRTSTTTDLRFGSANARAMLRSPRSHVNFGPLTVMHLPVDELAQAINQAYARRDVSAAQVVGEVDRCGRSCARYVYAARRLRALARFRPDLARRSDPRDGRSVTPCRHFRFKAIDATGKAQKGARCRQW